MLADLAVDVCELTTTMSAGMPNLVRDMGEVAAPDLYWLPTS
jgi:hypothetical protein